MKAKYSDFDAEEKFKVENIKAVDPEACQCGDVIKGIIKPWDCKIFGKSCTPEQPMGALMVSTEGACSAYFNYSNQIESETIEIQNCD